MVLISSLYLFWDARSWPDKVHDAWLALGLALAGPWPGPGWPLAWPLAGPWPGPWLALGLALGWPLAWPWLALGLALGWPGHKPSFTLSYDFLVSFFEISIKNYII